MSEQVNLRWRYPGMRKAARLLGIQDTTIYRSGILQELGAKQDKGVISITALDDVISEVKDSIEKMNDLLEELINTRSLVVEEMGIILNEPESSPEHAIRKILDELVKPLFAGKELYRPCHKMHESDPDEAFQGFVHEIVERSHGKIPPGMFPQDVLWNWAVDQGAVW